MALRFTIPGLLLTFGLTWMPVNSLAQELTEHDLQAIQLPMDKDDPVFEYDSKGGFTVAPPPGFKPTPMLRVFADGKVITGLRPGMQSGTQMLSENELNQFLHRIVNQHEFYSVSENEIKRTLMEDGLQPMIADASTSVFKANLQRGTHEVSIYALQYTAQRQGDIPGLNSLLEIEKLARDMIAKTIVASEPKIDLLLKTINQQRTEKFPESEPFDLNDIRYAARFENGSVDYMFLKPLRNSDPAKALNARYRRDPAGDVQIEIQEQVVR